MNDNQNPEQETAKYKVYLDERKLLVEAEKSGAQQFDKAILTLAAGALAISLAFVKDIAPHPHGWTVYFLSLAWTGFVLSLLSTLLSFLTSQAACRKQREILERGLHSEKVNCERSNTDLNQMASWTNRLNWMSILFFIVGVISLAVFSISNINFREENSMADKKMVQDEKVVTHEIVPPTVPVMEGFVPQKPPAKPPEKPPERPKKGE